MTASVPSRRRFVTLAASLAALPVVARAQAPNTFTVLEPARPTTVPAGKVEVLEFFWYGCPHCYSLEPSLDAWAQRKPADVELRRSPVAFGDPQRAQHSKLYFTLESMGLLPKLHSAVYASIHRDHLRLTTEDDLGKWAEQHGVDRTQFLTTFKSFGVATRTSAAERLTESYRIDGTPSIAVAGRFVTSPSQAGGNDKVFPIVDQLVARARSAR